MIRHHVILDLDGEEITLLITEDESEASAMAKAAGRSNRPYVWLEEETAEQARSRMTAAEREADLRYEQALCEACGKAWRGCGC